MPKTSLNIRKLHRKRNAALILSFIFIALLASAHAMYTVRDFHSIWPWEYKGEGLYEVDIGINRGTDAANTTLSDGTIVLAIGDINDSKHNDMITMSDDQMTVTVSYFNSATAKFGNHKEIPTGKCKTSAAFIIANPNYRIALLCTENAAFDYLKLFMNDNTFTNYELSDFKFKKGSQPLLIDINSDTFVDLVFTQNTNSGNYDIRVALYNSDSNIFETTTLGLLENYLYENSSLGCQSLPNKETYIFANPNFSTLVDVNNDCVADLYLNVVNSAAETKGLMLISTRLQINNHESMKYCLVEVDNLSASKFTSPVFADFNNDAAIDKGFYNTETNSIYLYYNEKSANSPNARNLCRAMPLIKDGETKEKFTEYSIFQGTPDITNLENVSGLYTGTAIASYIPGQLRASDLDSNGFPDILVTVKDTSGKVVTAVLINSNCDSSVSHNIKRNLATKANCSERTFNLDNDYNSLANYENTLYGFLIDFDDNGRMDIVLVATGTDGTTNLLSFYNNFARDSYYITATSYTTSSKAFGSKVYGASFRGIYTTLSDTNRAFVSAQLIRTTCGALESPVATFAIGRSNNYIEDFTATYPIQKYTKAGGKERLSVESRSWTPIIPNSHLLIDLSSKYGSQWGIKLLINPTDSFILVGFILTLILGIIGGIIIYLHVQEKKEDEESRNPQLDFF